MLEKLKNNKMAIVLLVLIGFFLIIGGSYALWVIKVAQTNANVILSDCFKVTLKEDSEAIHLEKTYPLTDEEGKALTPYVFTVTNSCSSYAKYDVRLEILEETTIGLEYIKVALNNEEPVLLSELTDTLEEKEGVSKILYLKTDYLDKNKEDSYEFRMWVDEKVTMEDPVANKTIKAKINIEASYIDEMPSYCERNPNYATCQILAQGETEELKFDNTTDNNLRYIGSNPNNYVQFNNELWRIIGVFNNIDNGTRTKEKRLKIIRNESIGNYSWDNKPSGTGSSTSSYGSNDWTDSTLKELLNNGPYWNRTSGNCSSGLNGTTKACDFTNTGLSEDAKTMISDAIWNLGGLSDSRSDISFYGEAIISAWYTYERGMEVYSGRPTEWTGKIGLVYLSDYGYATSGGSTTNRETCLNTALVDWRNLSECYNNDWLYNSVNSQWPLTPSSTNSNTVFYTSDESHMYVASAFINIDVSPALYLNSNVKISGGSGTEGNPFVLSM